MLIEQDIADTYSYLYSHAIPGKGTYGSHNRRAGSFVAWIREHVKKGSTILDAGCGRGHIIRWLIADGYVAEGTEIADWLMKPGGDLYGMPVLRKSYGELSNIQSDSFDAVISCDVLEHLQSETEVTDGMKNLARISKGPVLISTGGIKRVTNPFRHLTPLKDLHLVVRKKEWWLGVYETYCTVDKEFEAAGSYFLFGWKK